MSTLTTSAMATQPREPQSGEPDAGSRGPDVWPFETPKEQRERITPAPHPAERAPDERDVERPAEREQP